MNRSKRRRIGVANAVAVATTSHDAEEMPPPAPYTKLIAVCWEHIFDYLSFRDVIAMGHTCKQLSQLAGCYIREYHSELKVDVYKNEFSYEDILIEPGFYQYISKLSIRFQDTIELPSNIETCDSLKTIIFDHHSINRSEIKNMQNLLINIESIHLIQCKITRNIFTRLTDHCPKLKHLNIMQYNQLRTIPRARNLWMQLVGNQICTNTIQIASLNEKLESFLETHPRLEHLEVDYHFLWTNRDALMESNIQIDLLHLYFDEYFAAIREFVDYLQTLHRRGFYKTLKLSFCHGFKFDKVQNLGKTISALPGFEKLMTVDNSIIDPSCLTNLKELQCDSSEKNDTFAKSLPKLERIILQIADYSEILAFVRHSKTLKSIQIGQLLETNDFDLFELNEEREKLERASKVWIYVSDDDYLTLKWKLKDLNLSIVKITRLKQNTIPYL